jgi:putative zinc finger protein
MNCADVAGRVDGWIAGTLSDTDARDLERHATECAACAARLESAPALPELPATIAPPAALRAATLARVAARRRAVGRRRFVLAVSGIAAVVVAAIAVQPRGKSAQDFPGAGKVLLAMKRAKPEFAELDAAERDVAAALATTPGDALLVAARQRLQRERELLQRLVDEVNQ